LRTHGYLVAQKAEVEHSLDETNLELGVEEAVVVADGDIVDIAQKARPGRMGVTTAVGYHRC